MSQPSVLIVDDNARLLRGLTRVLSDEFQVATAVSAAEAMVMMAEDTFNVVIADHQMPGTLGVRLLANIKSEFPQVIPVLMSGELTPSVRRIAEREIGDCPLIEKPFRSVQVIEAIYAAMEQAEASTEGGSEDSMDGAISESN